MPEGLELLHVVKAHVDREPSRQVVRKSTCLLSPRCVVTISNPSSRAAAPRALPIVHGSRREPIYFPAKPTVTFGLRLLF